MQKLHLVGFTKDHDGLILSARRGSRSGGYVVAIDDALAQAVDEAAERRQEAAAEAEPDRPPRVESSLSVKEIQARLRQGRTVAEVAKVAGVEPAWVDRFAAPVHAERAQVIAKVRRLSLERARLGKSQLPVGEAVRHSLADRGVSLTADEYDEAWSARQVAEGRWTVRFRFHYRAKDQVLQFDLDEATGEISASDKAGQYGYIPPQKPSTRRKPAPEADRPIMKRAVVGSGYRADDTKTATSRSAKERERANAALRKAAAKRAADSGRATARLAKEKAAAVARAEREAKAAAARQAREEAAAQRARKAREAETARAAKKVAAEKAAAKKARDAERAKAAKATASQKAAETKDQAAAKAKKAAANSAPTKKAQAKQAPARKAPARKAPAKQAPTKKAAAKQTVAKKALANASKKAPTKKTVASKPPTSSVDQTLARMPTAADATPVFDRSVAEAVSSVGREPTAAPAPAPRPRPEAQRPPAGPSVDGRDSVDREPSRPTAPGRPPEKPMFRRGLVERVTGDNPAVSPEEGRPSNTQPNGLVPARPRPDRPRRTRPLRAT